MNPKPTGKVIQLEGDHEDYYGLSLSHIAKGNEPTEDIFVFKLWARQSNNPVLSMVSQFDIDFQVTRKQLHELTYLEKYDGED